MDDIKRIYSLLLHRNGLKIRDISKELELDKYYVAELLFSPQNISYWYQDDDSLWYAKEGALQIEEPEEKIDKLIAPVEIPQRFNVNRFLEEDLSDSLRYYLSQISKYRIYSNDEMIELFKRYRSGDQKAFDMIIKSQQRLVANIALLYCRKGAPLEDIIQEGNVGLVKAAERFDYTKYRSFSNYAKSWILQAISTCMACVPYLIKLPLNQLTLFRKVRSIKEKYVQKYGYEPSPSEIDLGENVDFDSLVYLSSLPDNLLKLTILSNNLDELPSNASADEALMKESEVYYVDRQLNKLERRKSLILRYKFGIGVKSETLNQIADRMGLTRERVRQISEKAIKELKTRINSPIVIINKNQIIINKTSEEITKEIDSSSFVHEIRTESVITRRKERKKKVGIKHEKPNADIKDYNGYTIENNKNRCAIYDSAKRRIYVSTGRIKILGTSLYRIVYTYSFFSVNRICSKEPGSFATGERLVYADSNSSLHKELINQHKDVLKQIERIIVDSSETCIIKINDAWYDDTGSDFNNVHIDFFLHDEAHRAQTGSVNSKKKKNQNIIKEAYPGDRIEYDSVSCVVVEKMMIRGFRRLIVKYDDNTIDNVPDDRGRYKIVSSRDEDVLKEINRTRIEKKKRSKYDLTTSLDFLVEEKIITRRQLHQCHKKKLRTIGDVKQIIEKYQLTPYSTRFTKYTLDMWFSIVGLLNKS